MQNKKILVTAISGSLLSLGSLAFAQGVDFAGGQLVPSLGLTLGYDDNIVQAETNEINSAYLDTKAGAKWAAKKGSSAFDAYGGVAVGRYFDSSEDNYEDYKFGGGVELAQSRRLKLNLDAGLASGHDSRGSTDRRAPSAKPDTYNAGAVDAKVTYGQEKSKGRLEVGASYKSKRYDEFSIAEKIEDKDTASATGAFFYQVKPKVDLLFELMHQDIGYQLDSQSGRDSTVQKARAGASWFATAKTTGSFKLGYARKDFDAVNLDTYSGVDWEAQIQWKPSSRSLVEFRTFNQAFDATGFGVYTTNQHYEVTLQHKWNKRFTSTIEGAFHNIDYEETSRQDDRATLAVASEYMLQNNIHVGGRYEYMERDSNLENYDYKRNIFSVYIKGTY